MLLILTSYTTKTIVLFILMLVGRWAVRTDKHGRS